VPHAPEDKRKAIARLRRIQGQAAAIERAIEAGTACAPVLQQIAALRGAVHGLMAEVLESHLRETLGPFAADAGGEAEPTLDASIDDAVKLVHTYLK
jgi:DNA-binding FrmR family transcriptional regulator